MHTPSLTAAVRRELPVRSEVTESPAIVELFRLSYERAVAARSRVPEAASA